MLSLIAAIATLPSQSHSLLLCGDIMLNGVTVAQRPFAKIAPLFRPAEAVLANLEIPLTSETRTTPNKPADEVRKRNQFILKADPKHASSIAAAGIDLVSLGNNHCMDYRKSGLDQMRKLLSKYNVLFAGAGDDEVQASELAVYTTRTGLRVGLLSALAFVGGGALGRCTPADADSSGVATLRFGGVIDKAAKADLAARCEAAKRQCDLLVIGLHWGIERQTWPTSYQVTLGRAFIDAGADLVWGNHPHVLQGSELYKGKPIVYSMGNLISSKGGPTGVLKVVYDGGKFSFAQLLPMSISAGQVRPVNGRPGQTACAVYKRLCDAVQARYRDKNSRSIFPSPNL